MIKNQSGQKLTVFAYDATTGLPKTGDAANITAYVSKDDGSVAQLGDTSATEQDATNAAGYYLFDVTQAETNADKLSFSAKSSTSNIVVLAVPSVIYTRPASFSALNVSGVNTLAGHDPGETIMGATDLGTGSGLTSLATAAALTTVDGVVDAIKAKTDNLPADPADESALEAAIAAIDTTTDVAAIRAVTDALPDAGALTSLAQASDVPTAIENADALLTRDWTMVTGAAARSVLNALRFLRNKWFVSGGTLTVTEEDDTTPAWTGTVDSDAGADPITGNTPD